MMTLFRLIDAVDKVLSEEKCGFRKERGLFGQIFRLRLIIGMFLSCQNPLILSFIDYKQDFDSADSRALVIVLS
jgi:hypothetical protein